ncbi:KCND2 [Symbiodinium sp. CCMP2592]|nr:KCND2 [Symbiodinium sp. CCMP2592]
MAVRDAQKTSEEERCVTFSLGDELFRYQANGESPCTFGLPWAPPSEKIFDLHFFWQLWSNLAKAAMRKDVPLVSLRNMSYMLNDTYKIPSALDVNFFGQLSKKYCSWPDLRHSLITEGHPSIKLSFLERVFLMLEEPNSCLLAKAWFYIIMFAAVANLTSFILPETATWMFEQIWGHHHHEKHQAIFSTVCILIFTTDYVSKLVCSPFVRVELVQPSEKYFHLDESQRAVVPQTGTQRCLDFMLQVTNIVDLLAILPWWLDLCFVKILPGAAFLRIIRISRIFHLFKSARYFDMVQVLGLTLWKSINLVGIVFALITVVGLFAACLLQQTEVTMGSQMSEVFETVPASWFWIFCRLIGMKDTIYGKGKVQSYFGIAILAVTLTLKGVLWIVPIARIRQIFSQEYAIVVNTSKARKKMIDDLLAFVAGSDQSLVQSRNGYICCNLQLYSITKEEAWVPLPLHQNEEVKLEKYRVALSSSASAAEVFLDILWKPGAAMKNSANSLPQGTLALTLVGGWRLPDGLHEIQWEVPVDTFSTEKQTVTLKAATKTTDTVTFEIAWTGSGEDDEPREIDDDLQMDYRDFQKQVLHLLQEQAELIQEQQQCVQEYGQRLKGLDSKL